MVRITKWELPRPGAPDNCKIGIKRSSILMTSITILSILLQPAALLLAASMDEEELIERNIIFSIPRLISIFKESELVFVGLINR